jgi:hypothetical protein
VGWICTGELFFFLPQMGLIGVDRALSRQDVKWRELVVYTIGPASNSAAMHQRIDSRAPPVCRNCRSLETLNPRLYALRSASRAVSIYPRAAVC